jgi:hypothetical protein
MFPSSSLAMSVFDRAAIFPGPATERYRDPRRRRYAIPRIDPHLNLERARLRDGVFAALLAESWDGNRCVTVWRVEKDTAGRAPHLTHRALERLDLALVNVNGGRVRQSPPSHSVAL